MKLPTSERLLVALGNNYNFLRDSFTSEGFANFLEFMANFLEFRHLEVNCFGVVRYSKNCTATLKTL
jgi:hypothetical protein